MRFGPSSNGDIDACVPYNGNEDWTTAMAAKLGMTVVPGQAWRPWVVDQVPAGYVTVRWGRGSEGGRRGGE
eukprot:SAG22_NODE_3248_length_1833_cov_1.974625_1_plen_71_part_00